MQPLTQKKNNVAALELMRQFGVSCCTAWLVKHEIVQAMRVASGAAQYQRRRCW